VKIDQQLPKALDVRVNGGGKGHKKPKRNSVVVAGVRYPLHQDPRSRVWRVRKRTREIQIDLSLGSVSLDDAIEEARKRLGKEHQERTRLRTGKVTLREICDIYESMPKRCSKDVAKANVQRLSKVLSDAWGRSLEEVYGYELTERLWEDYAAKRQGGELDLSTRRHENRGINSAIRLAVSIFHEGLEAGYSRAGVVLDFKSIRRVQWLPETTLKLPKLPKDSEEKLIKALPALKESNRAMWRAIMIARYAGLRSKEISNARRSWLVQTSAGAWCFEVCDRPEEGWWHKTGEDYTAPILSQELIDDLLACPSDGPLVPVEGSRDHFFDKLCADWIRQFIPPPNKTLHRLRALYAEALRDATANAILAQQAGTEAARKALGHTTSATTVKHYLPAS
jgi:hypothetical protein